MQLTSPRRPGTTGFAAYPGVISQRELHGVNEQQENLGAFPFVVGGLSFIPLIGVLFGVVAIAWGLTTKKAGGKKLALIGGGGIALSVVLYSALFYFGFVQRGGVYDDLRARLSEGTITSLVQAIEFYRIQNGKYPESLEVLRKSLPENSMVFVFDPTDIGMGGEPRYYHYELVNSEHYYLLGVGPDGQPFTQDDILPKVDVGPQSKVGLLIKGR
jgi:hypothetical protein